MLMRQGTEASKPVRRKELWLHSPWLACWLLECSGREKQPQHGNYSDVDLMDEMEKRQARAGNHPCLKQGLGRKGKGQGGTRRI